MRHGCRYRSEPGLPLTGKKKRKEVCDANRHERSQARSLLHGQDMGTTKHHRNSIEQWLGVGGGWRRLAVGGWWRLVAVGGWWRLVAVGGWWRLVAGGGQRSLRAVLKKKNGGS